MQPRTLKPSKERAPWLSDEVGKLADESSELKKWDFIQMTENTTRILQGKFNADADVISRVS